MIQKIASILVLIGAVIPLGDVLASGTLEDSECVRNTPTVTFSSSEEMTVGLEPAAFIVTVVNNDSPVCKESIFSLTAATSTLSLATSLEHSALRIIPGGNATVHLLVTPVQTMSLGRYSISLSAKNISSPDVIGSGFATLLYTAPQCTIEPPSIGLDPIDQSVQLGGTATFIVSIRNRDSVGCDPRAFRLAGNLPEGFVGRSEPDHVIVRPGFTTTVIFQITVPAETEPGPYPFELKTTEPQELYQGRASGSLNVEERRPIPAPVPLTELRKY